MIHLELNNINQAAKINFHLYYQYHQADDVQKTELSYLSFINKTTGQSAAAYFIAALGCDKGIASAGATRKLPNEVKKFFKTQRITPSCKCSKKRSNKIFRIPVRKQLLCKAYRY